MLSSVLLLLALAGEGPVVIAHRGASGFRPEHTLAAYTLGIEQGADAIEPDLVMSRDGHLVARHDLDLGRSTDVAQRFPDRTETRDLDGATHTGWFADLFTLAELRTLKAREPRPDRSTAHDGQHALVTWPEVLALAMAQPEPVPLVPELKHVAHLQARGHDPIPPFLQAIEAARYPHERLWVQCFEVAPLKTLRAQTDLRLVQLIGHPDEVPADGGPPYKALLTPEGLKGVAEYAQAIGVHKRLVLPLKADGSYGAPTSLVADAHAAGLQVHVYTFRDEASERPAVDATPEAELQRFYALGVDAVFADSPKTAVGARKAAKP
jgi:glycerophosphoryl diester phosphodiesterase